MQTKAMDFNEATNAMKPLIQAFAGLGRLDEILRTAANAERAVYEAENRKAKLEQDITDLNARMKTLSASVAELEEARGKARDELDAVRMQNDQAMAQLADKLKRAEADHKEQMQGFIDEAKAARRTLDEELERARVTAQARKEEYEKGVQATKAALDKLKAQLAGVGA